jgi:DNA-binding PadR family transcriptional regulator
MDGMALEIFILSVLRTGPVHGYELKRRVQRPSTLTPLSNNSIYPALRRFERDGQVTATVEEQSGKPARRVYAITDSGRALLHELISTLPDDLASSEEEFLVRVSFFAELKPAQRLTVLAARGASLARSAERVEEFVSESDDAPKRRWRNVVMDEYLSRIHREKNWIATLEEKAAQ